MGTRSTSHHRAMAVLLSTTVLLAGCAADIQVGTGEHVYKQIDDGSSLPLACGMGGEKYIVAAVRTQTLNPVNADVVVEVKTKDTGAIVCDEAVASAQLETVDGWQQCAGIHCFVDASSNLDGRSVIMTGAIRDTSGANASTSVSFKLAAPSSGCGG